MPIKMWGQRFSLGLLILAGAGLLIFSRADDTGVRRFQAWVHDAAAPFLDGLSRPAEGVESLLTGIKSMVALEEENAALRREIQRLRGWETVARRLDQENRVLRRFLNAKAEGLGPVIAGRVIGDPGGPYVRAVIVNAGRNQGVEKGRAVTDGRNVIGRVLTVGHLSARILLLTDLNSRLPVMVADTGARAILAGDNTDLPALKFVPVGAEVTAGDRILTSGDGGIFPPRLPVGQVIETEDRGFRVQPFADFGRLDYVLVLDYHFPSLKEPVEETEEVETAEDTS